MNRPRHTQGIHFAFAIAAGAGLMVACGSNVQLGSQGQNSGGAGTSGGVTSAGGIAPTGGTAGAGGAIPSGGTTRVGSGGSGGLGSTGGSPNTGGTKPAGGATAPGGGAGSGGATRAGGATALGGTTATGGAGGSTGKTCGGMAGLPCAAGEICDIAMDPLCMSDGFGTCVVQPQVCAENWQPVCGCDGKTYSNDCFRQSTSYGVPKRSDGACPTTDAGAGGSTGTGGSTGAGGSTRTGGATGAGGATGTGGTGGSTGKTCGGVAGLPCAAGEICALGMDPLCLSDMNGTCMVQPQGCTADWNPVCGCDGKTYSNDCTRLSTNPGVPKRSDGACTTDAGQDVGPSVDAPSPAALCTATGGQVVSTLCCNSAADFPNSCLGGACGCAPASSHTVSTCTCATGCFAPGYGCVTCTVGADQTCNDNLSDNSLHGQCVNGRCSCNTGSVLLASGKCQ